MIINRYLMILRTAILWISLSAAIWVTGQPIAAQEVKSHEAAILLNEVIDDFPPPQLGALNKYDHISLEVDVVKLLVANRQLDDALSFAETREVNENLFKLISVGKLEILTDGLKAGISRRQIDREVSEFKRIAKRSNGKDVRLARSDSLYSAFTRMLETGQIKVAKEIAEATPGDLEKYEVKAYWKATTSQELAAAEKHRMLSAIASAELRSGNFREAKKIFDQFGVLLTRDGARLYAIRRCLEKDNLDIKAAEKALAMIESTRVKFSSCHALGMHFVQMNDTKNALRYALLMDEYYKDTPKNSQRSLGRLLACVAQMQISEGDSADWALKRAQGIELNLEDQFNFATIKVMTGNTDDTLKKPALSLAVVSQLLDLENYQLREHSPLQHLPPEKRVEEAIKFARKIEQPYLKAKALTEIADQLYPVPISDGRTLGLPTKKSATVFDLERSLEFTNEAFEAASQIAEPVELRPSQVIDQPLVLQHVATLFAKHGQLKQMLEAVDLVPNGPGTTSSFGNNKGTKKDQALSKAGIHITESDKPFVVNDGAEAFECLEALKTFDALAITSPVRAIVAKFAQLGLWDKAEKAKIIADEMSSQARPIQYKVICEICKSDDAKCLRRWCEICPDEFRSVYLHHIGLYFSQAKSFPSQPFLIEFEAMADNCEEAGETLRPTVRNLLVVGYSLDKMDEKANFQLEKIIASKGGDASLSAIAATAMANGLPDLAVKASESIEDRNGFNVYPDLSIRKSKNNSDFQPEQLKNKQWLDAQPLKARISFKMRRAKELIKASK